MSGRAARKREDPDAAETGEQGAAVIAAPESPPGEGILRVRLDSRKWVDMTHPLDAEDMLTLWRLETLDVSDTNAITSLYGPILGMIEKHCSRHNLDGRGILQRPLADVLPIWKAWNKAIEDSALDPTPAAD